MGFWLIPREEKFFDMFDEVAAVINKASAKFLTMVTDFNDLAACSNELKHLENMGDGIVERIVMALDRSFITPFDREDIHALATSLDDILDNMDETAHRFAVFRIDRPTPAAVQMARIIQQCSLHLESAIHQIRTVKDAERVQNHLREISQLENEADTIYRDTDSACSPIRPTS